MFRKMLILSVILALVSILAWRNSHFGQQTLSVDIETLTKHTLRASILASGRISHEEEVLLSTEVIGLVTDVLVKEGMAVEKGQLLLRIDDEALLATVEQHRANTRLQEIAIDSQLQRLKNLERQLEQNRKLYDRGLLEKDTFETFISEVELGRIELSSRRAALLQSQAVLEEAENRLTKTRIYSPLSGVITSLDIKEGETAISSTTNVPGSSLMTIANPASILTEVNVDEADIANVSVGQEAEIVAIAYQDKPMRGVVESIAMSAKRTETSQSLSFAVKIRFTDTAGVTLRPGMSCRAEIFTHSGTPLLAVPIRALQLEEDLSSSLIRYHVFIDEGGIAQRREVQVGLSDDEYQEITGGIEAGATIITGPDRVLRSLREGDRITMSAND